jgi:hypothetical protein
LHRTEKAFLSMHGISSRYQWVQGVFGRLWLSFLSFFFEGAALRDHFGDSFGHCFRYVALGGGYSQLWSHWLAAYHCSSVYVTSDLTSATRVEKDTHEFQIEIIQDWVAVVRAVTQERPWA